MVPLELTAEASVINLVIQKKIRSGTRTSIFSNEELNDIIKIGLLIKGVTETVQNKIKEQNRGYLAMLAATLSASLLEN